MSVFVRFHRSPRWHIVATNRWEWMVPVTPDDELFTEGEFIPTVCGEPSIGDPDIPAVLSYPVSRLLPFPVCARCKEQDAQ